jgi:hypothetical protein
MNWKMTLTSAALAMATLLPSAALADGPRISVGVNLPPVSITYRQGDLPPPPPQNVPQQTGRYELQTVSNYIPGRYEQVMVPGQCFTEYRGRHHRHARTVCTPDRYENRWVEGRYEQVQQWVWVEYGRWDHRQDYGRRWDNDDDNDHDYRRRDGRYNNGYGRSHGASRVR